MVLLFFLILLLIFLDGIISATEAAILSIPLNRARLMVAKKNKGKILLRLKESMERPIATLASLSNLVVIMGSIFTGFVAAQTFGEKWLGVFSAFLTFLIVVFAEIIPKRIGERYSESIAFTFAPFVQVAAIIFSPVIWIIERILFLFPFKKKGPSTSEDEIRFLVELGKKEGSIEDYEGSFIQSVFKLKDVTAGDMMTPRPFVFALEGKKTLAEARQEIEEAKHSRIPVFEDKLNNITGIVHQRDLLRALAQDRDGTFIKDYLKKPLIVPESRLGDDLLRDFLASRCHLAIVVDEHGNVAGVVGLEDVIEEIIGEVIDEKDVSPELIKRIARNVVLVHGQTPLSSVNRFFNLKLSGQRNLNGFLLNLFGRLPQKGESIKKENLTFIIEEVNPSSIGLARIVKEEDAFKN